ncbi:MAG: gamma-glutamyltransferase family protein [Sphaerochaetaceae bacterium]
MKLEFDPIAKEFPLSRFPVYGKKGMVASSSPEAATAASKVMYQGGNAIDAAVAAAAALTVVEPTCNGIGSDAFALVWSKGKLHGLNASGPAPKLISLEKVKQRGHNQMPTYGWEAVTVPGAPAAWAELNKRFGSKTLTEVMAPAIELAYNGFAISANLSTLWQQELAIYKRVLNSAMYKPWFETFTVDGKAPACGHLWRSSDHGDTLALIAETNAQAFYSGKLADRIDAFSRQHEGFLRLEDLAAFTPEWVEPISTSYRGFDVWEIPPNGQGLSALLALNILESLGEFDRFDERAVHTLIEATKLAMSDGGHYITDPKYMGLSSETLLSKSYAAQRAAQIGEKAALPEPGTPSKGGTVYVATADDQGNMVSYIQSNYMAFGSALVVPHTGIALQNRGANFSLDPEHINCLAGGKRTFHTIIPGFLSAKGTPIGPFGVMGGFNQPQGHVQLLTNTIDQKLNPQAALDAPRWRWTQKKQVLVEPSFPSSMVESLRKRGHQVVVSADQEMFGRGQIIWYDNTNKTFVGGTESRTDSVITLA